MRARFTLAAFEDLAAISQWHEAPVADRLESAVFAAADRLEKQPELGVHTDDRDVRRWPMPEHRLAIFYRINWRAERLDILRVIDTRQLRDLHHAP
jgi:plasmid stabilization system protein ParE